MHYRKPYLYLGMILLLAAGLRLWGLTGRGLFYADETRYYRDAVNAKASLKGYFASGSEKGIKQFFAALSPIDSSQFAQKPGHSSLGLAGLYVFGDYQYSVLIVSALLGIATVLLVFLIGYKFYGARHGLVAALLLAVCPAHVLFSRSFLTHTNEGFFILLAAYLYLLSAQEGKGSIFYAGAAASLGYAFLVHPTGLIYFMPFFLCEAFLWLGRKRSFGKLLLFVVFFSLPFLIIEIISALGKKEFGSLAVALKGSYAQQLFLTSSSAAEYGTENNKNLGPFHLVVMNFLCNGPMFTLAWVIGGVHYLFNYITHKGRQVRDFVFAAMPAGLFIYWQFIAMHERLFREIVFLFPFFCIMVAVFITRLNKKATILIIAILALEGCFYSAKAVLFIKSRYGRVEKFLADNEIEKLITPSEYFATTSDVLMPGARDLRFYRVSGMAEARKTAARENIRYIAILPGDWLESEEFRMRGAPVIRVPEPTSAYFPLFFEAARAINRPDWVKYYKENPNAASVSVYKIEDKGG